MSLIQFKDVSIAFGLHDLLKQVNWQLDPRQRVALIGRNGAGKSTFLKIVANEHQVDSGTILMDSAVKIGYLPQELPPLTNQTVYEVVSQGLASLGAALAEFDQISQSADPDLKRLEKLQQIIESQNGWDFNNRIEQVLQRLQLPANQTMDNLSGGWRRRVLLAQALVQAPDVLLLDEPTNHLDIEMIKWLETHLKDFPGAILFISHDRQFVDQVCTHMLELDRGNVLTFQGNYEAFCVYKQKTIEDEQKAWSEFDKKLAQEEVWIRQGIKARRTRNEGRVRALESLRKERSKRLESQGNVNFAIQSAGKSGKMVFEVKGLSHRFDDNLIVTDFSTLVRRGDRIGLVGPNGIGKSTIIKLLMGQLETQEGNVRQGENIAVGYFDQQRATLDPNKTVKDVVSEGSDFIDINGKSRHIISYLEDFLFSPERARSKVSALSGGEANRLVLARLFSQPLNLLILDEPTNDLDMETLELLEGLLLGFNGTILLVSHDRAFLDNVVTDVWAFEGQGQVRHYVGGYEDWLAQGGKWPEATAQAEKPVEVKKTAEEKVESNKNTTAKKKKLSYKLQREYEQLPQQIEKLEQDIAALEAQAADPDFYSQSHDKTGPVLAALEDKQGSLEGLMDRWLELEELAES